MNEAKEQATVVKRPFNRVLTLLVLTLCLARGQADELFPRKPITIIVPYPAGSIGDVHVRKIGDIASRESGWRFIVENRPGAMGTIGLGHAARSSPDGYTIVSGSSSDMNLLPAFGMKLAFDPVRSFAPITQWARGSMLLVVPSTLEVNSVAELLTLAKSRADPLLFGSTGPGTITFFASKLLEKKLGSKVLDVTYKSGSLALLDLIPGRLDFQFDFISTSLPHIKAGRLKPLMVVASRRAPLLPDVPTAMELGLSEIDMAIISGFFAPRGTPSAVMDKLHRVLVAAIRSTELERTLAEAGAEAIASGSEEFASVMAADRRRWDEIIWRTGLHVK